MDHVVRLIEGVETITRTHLHTFFSETHECHVLCFTCLSAHYFILGLIFTHIHKF